MSYAKIAAQNAAPEERQAHPDTSLLTTPADVAQGPTSPQGAPEDLAAAEKAHVVERAEFEKLRDAVEHADEVQQPDPFAEAAEHQEERDQARLKGQAQAELKRATEAVDASAGEAKQKGDELARDAKQAADKGKKEAKEAFAEGKKEAKDLAGKLEREGKAEAKKLQRKAGEVEREGRDLAKRYPAAATGLVGLANALLIAVPAYYAYANWHHPRWDRRIVSAVAVGLGAVFSAEGALGWFEYKQEH